MCASELALGGALGRRIPPGVRCGGCARWGRAQGAQSEGCGRAASRRWHDGLLAPTRHAGAKTESTCSLLDLYDMRALHKRDCRYRLANGPAASSLPFLGYVQRLRLAVSDQAA
jgi:hypothetical protein